MSTVRSQSLYVTETGAQTLAKSYVAAPVVFLMFWCNALQYGFKKSPGFKEGC